MPVVAAPQCYLTEALEAAWAGIGSCFRGVDQGCRSESRARCDGLLAREKPGPPADPATLPFQTMGKAAFSIGKELMRPGMKPFTIGIVANFALFAMIPTSGK